MLCFLGSLRDPFWFAHICLEKVGGIKLDVRLNGLALHFMPFFKIFTFILIFTSKRMFVVEAKMLA